MYLDYGKQLGPKKPTIMTILSVVTQLIDYYLFEV